MNKLLQKKKEEMEKDMLYICDYIYFNDFELKGNNLTIGQALEQIKEHKLSIDICKA